MMTYDDMIASPKFWYTPTELAAASGRNVMEIEAALSLSTEGLDRDERMPGLFSVVVEGSPRIPLGVALNWLFPEIVEAKLEVRRAERRARALEQDQPDIVTAAKAQIAALLPNSVIAIEPAHIEDSDWRFEVSLWAQGRMIIATFGYTVGEALPTLLAASRVARLSKDLRSLGWAVDQRYCSDPARDVAASDPDGEWWLIGFPERHQMDYQEPDERLDDQAADYGLIGSIMIDPSVIGDMSALRTALSDHRRPIRDMRAPNAE